MHSLRIHYAIITQFHYAVITQFITQSITQLNYAKILKITRLRNGGNYAEINQNYAMTSQLGPLVLPGPEAAVETVIAECSAILPWPF